MITEVSSTNEQPSSTFSTPLLKNASGLSKAKTSADLKKEHFNGKQTFVFLSKKHELAHYLRLQGTKTLILGTLKVKPDTECSIKK